jgi:hypothetical protein
MGFWGGAAFAKLGFLLLADGCKQTFGVGTKLSRIDPLRWKVKTMLPATASGFLTILLGGVVQGTILTPMPYLKKWAWENIWLVYSIFAYLLLPWLFAFITVTKVLSVFAATPHEA